MAGGDRRAGLLSDAELERSAVVANCAMNRERQLAGVNSYARELGFDPLAFLRSKIAALLPDGTAAWLDLCCGAGRALAQAAARLTAGGLAAKAVLAGVDLAGMFVPVPAPPAGPQLITASAGTWEPDRFYDLITCVHGLHYIGDKLALLTRAVAWLSPGGLLAADFDLGSIHLPGGQEGTRRLAARLRGAGFTYNARRHQITRTGPAQVSLPYTYLGADDHAGPGYTGQPAVCSHYDDLPAPAAPGPARSR